jgi:hypothetical protein
MARRQSKGGSVITISCVTLLLAGLFTIEAIAARRERKQIEALFRELDARRANHETHPANADKEKGDE